MKNDWFVRFGMTRKTIGLSAVALIAIGAPGSAAWAQNGAPVPPRTPKNNAGPALPAANETPRDATTHLGVLNVIGTAVGGDRVPPAFAGGQVATGGRVGILGEQRAANVPFSVISYTAQLARNQQASTVGDVLVNNASVSQAFGYGNYAQIFLVRGFPLDGDDLSFDGLTGVLPRQIVQANFVQRVELFLGANAFTNGVSPGGSGVGGVVNLVPKRAQDKPTRRFTLGYASDSRFIQSFDVGQRFGPNQQFGARVEVRHEKGDTAVRGENLADTSIGLGLDWRGKRARASFDFGFQHQHIKHGRSVVYTYALKNTDVVPAPPDANRNYAPSFAATELQNEFGALRGSFDISHDWTAFAAVGANQGKEQGQYGSPAPTDFEGKATVSRLGVPFERRVFTGQAGLRGDFNTGPISHKITLAYSGFNSRSDTAYTYSGSVPTNLYHPHDIGFLPTIGQAGDLGNPAVHNRVHSSGWAASDTLGFFQDRVLATIGARYQADHVFNYDYNGNPTQAIRGHRVSPVYGIVYKPSDWASLYANHIEGLQPGDAAPSQAVNRGQVVGLVDSSQYEVGGKLDFGFIGGSLALYQIREPQGYVNDADVYGYFGDQRNRGIELNVYGKPTERLTINTSATYIDADQRDTGNTATNGKTAIGVPDYRVVVGGDYQLPDAPRWHVTGRIIRSGKQYADAANSLPVKGFTRVDLGVRYKMPFGPNNKRHVVWRANVNNIANASYWESAQGGYLSQGEPRTFLLSATVNFE